MRRRKRGSSVVALAVATAMLVVTMPASALGAVTLTWERNWGSKGTLPALANGEFYYPSDVATDKWGNVYVAGGEDGDHRIQMFAPDGTFLKSVGTVSAPSTLLDRPKSVATDRWGNIYVGEYGNGHRINVFFPELYNGVSARTIDGTGDSDIASPRTISVGLDGTLYTVKSGAEIQRWTSGGDYLGKWTAAGWATTGIGVAQDGNVYTTTDQDGGTTHSVVKYDALGDYLDDWGGFGSTDGLLNRPYDVGTDPLENVYVIESMGARGQVFESAGTFLTTFGTPGSGDGQFNLPYGISVSLDRNVYVAEQFGHRISKWNATVPTEAREVAGPNRYATAVEASKRAYPDGCDTVVIATGANWPDALGGAALAGAVHAPLLLTTKDSLPAVVSAEIDRLDAHYAYVLGSNAAVSDAVVTQLQGHLMMTNRLGGADRYATANLIAAETVDRMNADGGYDGTAFVATGLNFPDALAASPIAAANGWPIYLTRKTDLPSTVRSAMIANGSNHGYILGSTDAVGAAVATELNTAPFMEFTRYGGTNRYETAAKIADAGFDGMGMLWSRPALAVGTNFPDALAGGVLQGSDCSVILLTPKDTLDPYAAAALTANRDSIYELRFLGSTAALGDVPRNAAKALLH